MSLTLDTRQLWRHDLALEAIEFAFGDSLAEARKWHASRGDVSFDPYPYALGQAKSIIKSLLEQLGYADHGPDRFDCEWWLAHPVELSEAADSDGGPS